MMSLVSLTNLPAKGALLGLDPGSKTIGVAACDPGRMIASPIETIVRGKNAADRIAARAFSHTDDKASFTA